MVPRRSLPSPALFLCCCFRSRPPAGAWFIPLTTTTPPTSAAAFTKAMLDLEGNSLTPILVSLVNKDASMLEAFGKGASDDIADAKEALYQVCVKGD